MQQQVEGEVGNTIPCNKISHFQQLNNFENQLSKTKVQSVTFARRRVVVRPTVEHNIAIGSNENK